MAGRIPLPRLTQRQRSARWQRERRQQTIVVVAFSSVLFFVLGLVTWAAANDYYSENLQQVAVYDGRSIPAREMRREQEYQLVPYYLQIGVPFGSENSPQLTQDKRDFESSAIDALLEQAALDDAATQEGIGPSQAEIDERFRVGNSQYRSRHILITTQPDPDRDPATPEDPAAVAARDAAALAEAEQISAQLRAAPQDQDLWNRLASEHSDDPGSRDSGGEIGLVSRGDLVPQYERVGQTQPIGEVSPPTKSDFGYHVIQVQERLEALDSELVKRYLALGIGLDRIKDHVRYDILREELTRLAQERAVQSPTEQIRLAAIIIATPTPTSNDFAAFSAALEKIDEVAEGIENGTDFAELAREYSEDGTAANGGEIGWAARGMLVNIETEEELFQLEAGQVSREFATGSSSTFYKVLERDPSRAITEEQRTQINAGAYANWLQRWFRDHDARRTLSFTF